MTTITVLGATGRTRRHVVAELIRPDWAKFQIRCLTYDLYIGQAPMIPNTQPR